MVSIASLKSSSAQHSVHFVNYDAFSSIIDTKAGCALWLGYHVIDKSLPQHVLEFSVRSRQDVLPSSTPLVQIWSLLAPKN